MHLPFGVVIFCVSKTGLIPVCCCVDAATWVRPFSSSVFVGTRYFVMSVYISIYFLSLQHDSNPCGHCRRQRPKAVMKRHAKVVPFLYEEKLWRQEARQRRWLLAASTSSTTMLEFKMLWMRPLKRLLLRHHPKKQIDPKSAGDINHSGTITGPSNHGSVPMAPPVHGAVKAPVDTDKAKKHKAEEPLEKRDSGADKTPSEGRAKKP